MIGDGLTAEQLYQLQLNNWIAQQGAANNNAVPNEEVNVQNVEVEFQPNWGKWPAPPPQAPPALYNFQEWLANEGLQVQDGIHPTDNMMDNPAAAWNDSISLHSSSDSSLGSEDLVLVPVSIMQALQRNRTHP